MKILHVIRRWKGGVGRYIESINKILEDLGHETKVISRDDDLKYYKYLGSGKLLRNAVDELRKSFEYDVLVLHDWSIAKNFINHKRFQPMVCTFHAVDKSYYGKFQQESIHQFIPTISVGPWVKQQYENSFMVYEGVDFDYFRPIPIKKSNGEIKIGFAQSMTDDMYRFEMLNDALDLLGEPYVIYPTNFKLTKEELVEWYNTLDVFVSIPTEVSGFNLCWLEAMSCNCKVVGNNSGIGCMMPFTKVKEHTPENIALAIEAELKKTKLKYQDFLFKKGFTWLDCAANLLTVYEWVIWNAENKKLIQPKLQK